VTALAQIFSRTGAQAEAVSVLTDALRAHPRDEELLYTLGTVLHRSGATAQAIARMRELLEVNPRNAAAMNFIGYTLADRGEQLDEAEQLVRRALAIHPDNGAYLDSLGWVQFRRGDPVRDVGAVGHHRVVPFEPFAVAVLGQQQPKVSSGGRLGPGERGGGNRPLWRAGGGRGFRHGRHL